MAFNMCLLGGKVCPFLLMKFRILLISLSSALVIKWNHAFLPPSMMILEYGTLNL